MSKPGRTGSNCISTAAFPPTSPPPSYNATSIIAEDILFNSKLSLDAHQESRIILAIHPLNTSQSPSVRAAVESSNVPHSTLRDRFRGCTPNANFNIDPRTNLLQRNRPFWNGFYPWINEVIPPSSICRHYGQPSPRRTDQDLQAHPQLARTGYSDSSISVTSSRQSVTVNTIISELKARMRKLFETGSFFYETPGQITASRMKIYIILTRLAFKWESLPLRKWLLDQGGAVVQSSLSRRIEDGLL